MHGSHHICSFSTPIFNCQVFMIMISILNSRYICQRTGITSIVGYFVQAINEETHVVLVDSGRDTGKLSSDVNSDKRNIMGFT